MVNTQDEWAAATALAAAVNICDSYCHSSEKVWQARPDAIAAELIRHTNPIATQQVLEILKSALDQFKARTEASNEMIRKSMEDNRKMRAVRLSPSKEFS